MRSDCDGYVAAVMTVRNERDLLQANIAFHRYVGIDRFYIYLDHPQDCSADSVANDPGVCVLRSSMPRWLTSSEVSDSPRLRSRIQTHHTARQIVNCHDAIRRARSDGASWLVSLDPDELVLAGDETINFGALAFVLNSLPAHVESVTFPTSEVVPTELCYSNVFKEETLFKRRYGYGEGTRFGHSMRPIHEEWQPGSIDTTEYSRKLAAATGTLSFRLSVDCSLSNIDTPAIMMASLLNSSAAGAINVCDWYIGHVIGKQAFRIGREIHFDSLHTVRTSSKTADVVRGRLLHYNCYSYGKFLSKYLSFRHHPNSYAKGSPVDELKLTLRDAVNCMHPGSGEYLLNIYKTQICLSRERRSAILELWPNAIQRIDYVSDAFKRGLICPPVRKTVIDRPA